MIGVSLTLPFFPEGLHGWDTEVVAVSKEPHCLALADGRLARLHPLAPPHAFPHALEKPNRAAFDVGPVVLSHDGFDGFSRLASMVERDGGNSMMQNVRFDNIVEEVVPDETKITVDSGRSSTDVVPRFGLVMGQRGIGVV